MSKLVTEAIVLITKMAKNHMNFDPIRILQIKNLVIEGKQPLQHKKWEMPKRELGNPSLADAFDTFENALVNGLLDGHWDEISTLGKAVLWKRKTRKHYH